MPLGFVVATVALIALSIGFRLASFSDVYDNAQPGPMAYTIDAAVNGNWLMQHEPSGEIATKPPMYQWLAAIGVLVTGSTSEFVFKLPSLIAFLLTTLLIYDLARQSMDIRSALVAPIAWVANYHTFKLMYTARPDMLLTFFIVLGVWAVQRQRAMWTAAPGLRVRRSSMQWVMIAMFWLAVAGAGLTKGPPAVLPVLFAIFAITLDGAWKKCRPGAQLIGLILSLGLIAAWLVPAIREFPQWIDTINTEVVDRVRGEGTGAHRNTPFGAIPGYFIARFAPWSVLCVIALVSWKRSGTPAIRWTLWWIGLILVFFMIPKGKRADYIVPAYAGGAVLVAGMIDRLVRERGTISRLMAMIFGAFGVAGVVVFVAAWLVPKPLPIELPSGNIITPSATHTMVILAGFVALVAGAINLAFSDVHQLRVKAICGGFVVVSVLGIYQGAYSRAARTRAGDIVYYIVDRIVELREGDAPIGFYDIDKIPIASLMGINRITTDAELDIPARGGLLLISTRQWERQQHRYPASEVIVETDKLPEGDRAVLLVRIDAPQ